MESWIKKIIEKKFKHPKYGVVIGKAIKAKGANFGKIKQNMVLLANPESRENIAWVGYDKFMKEATPIYIKINNLKTKTMKKKKGKTIKAYSKLTSPRAKDTSRDEAIKAMKPGKRRSRTGKIYYETRANRADSNPKDRLERGGIISKLFKK